MLHRTLRSFLLIRFVPGLEFFVVCTKNVKNTSPAFITPKINFLLPMIFTKWSSLFCKTFVHSHNLNHYQSLQVGPLSHKYKPQIIIFLKNPRSCEIIVLWANKVKIFAQNFQESDIDNERNHLNH